MPDVRRLAVASVASQVADWSGRLVLAILLFADLGLAWVVGIAGSMFFLAWLGPGQLLAARSVHLGATGAMMRAERIRALVFGAAALPFVPLHYGLLVFVVVVAALGDPLFEINRASLAVEVAGDQYGPVIKLLTSLHQVAQLVGFAVGGVLLALLGSRVTLAGIAVLFVVSSLGLSRIEAGGAGQTKPVGGNVGAAKRFFTSDRLSALAFGVSLLTAGGAMMIEAIPAVYGSELGLSESGVGLIAAALPGMTLLGVAGVRTRTSAAVSLAWALAAAGVASAAAAVLLGSAQSLAIAMVGYGAVGLVFMVSIAGNVVVGARIPADERNAVFGVIQGVLYSTMAAAAALGGLIAELAGARATAIGASVFIALVAAAAIPVTLRLGAADDRNQPDRDAQSAA